MAKIILSLSDENQRRRAAEALAEKGHAVSLFPPLKDDDDLAAAAAALLEEKGEAAVLEYRAEDAASVKLMQNADDAGRSGAPAFIFIEPPGLETEREQALMVLNEGACAFLPAGFNPAALVNYVERAVLGPGRLRRRAQHSDSSDESLKRLEEALGEARTQSAGFKKLIARLLSAPAGSINRKLLLLSDSPYQLEMLKKILEDHNFQVLTANSPADGLNLALSERPRIVVSDLELEGQTGPEFCQTLKFANKLIPCHFVVCTANQSKISKVMTPGNGVDDCMLKPSGATDAMEFVSRVALGLLL